MKKQNNNRGITLIALVITIIIMLILAGVSMTLAINGGLFNYAKEAATETTIQRDLELSSVDYYMDLIKHRNVLINEEIEAENGSIVLPVLLNDCSKEYELEIESSVYSGPVILNVYSFEEGEYFGKFSINGENSYVWNLRDHLDNNVDETGLITFEYDGRIENGEKVSILTFDDQQISSEDLKVTNIYGIDREYSTFSKLVLNLKNSKSPTVKDYSKFIQYALDYDYLGYDLLNAMAAQYGSEVIESGITGNTILALGINESYEEELLETLLKDEGQVYIEALENVIRDNIIMCVMGSGIQGRIIEAENYTCANYFEENKYLCDFCSRYIGNTIIPFMMTYINFACIPDLNDDGRVAIGNVRSVYDIRFDNEEDIEHNIAINSNYLMKVDDFAGLTVRYYADLLSVMYKYNDQNMTENDAYLLNEMRALSKNILSMNMYFWYNVYELYGRVNLNKFYTMMYDADIKVNVAGIRMGYYQGIMPFFVERYNNGGFNFDNTYNFKEDTKYLRMQGVEEFLEYIDLD